LAWAKLVGALAVVSVMCNQGPFDHFETIFGENKNAQAFMRAFIRKRAGFAGRSVEQWHAAERP
jgi:hypothetical protein